MKMVSHPKRLVIVSCLLLSAFVATTCHAQDWPKWRGPNGDGISTETDLARQWPTDGPKADWTIKVGAGYASPVAVGNMVYVFAQESGMDVLCAIDMETRSKIWSKGYANKWNDRRYPGPRATPTIVDDMIYTLGGGGDLCCWRRSDGEIIWRKNILNESGSKNLTWGCSSSIMADGDTLYMQVGYGGSIAVAVNRLNGKIIWWSQYKGFSGYAPIVKGVSPDDDEILIVYGGIDVVAMDPKTGKTYWEYPHETEWKVNAATPIVHGPKVMFTNEYKSGKATQLDISKYRTKVLWTNKGFCSRIATPILEGDLLYGHNRGKLKCVNWSDGKEVWSDTAPGVNLGMGGTLVKAGDLAIALSDSGHLWLLEMNAKGASVLSGFRLLHEKNIWATPLIHKGKLLVKSSSQLTCLDISTEKRP